MYIARKKEETIIKYIDSPEIIAVIGPRQCGKTTMLKHIYSSLDQSKAVFLTFEDKKLLDLFVEDIEAFIDAYIKPNKYIFIDEFQYAKKGGQALKFIIDTSPKKIFISGSSSIDLTVQAVKYLVGRIFVFPLFHFDFEEYLSFKDKESRDIYAKHKVDFLNRPKAEFLDPLNYEKLEMYYEEFALYGGYPRVVISQTVEEKKMVLQNIYNTYFLREVKDILGLVDDYKLSRMVNALASQIGGLVEYNEISKISELHYKTVKSYLNFLEKTFISCFIKPYFSNKRTEIVKNPKCYFWDTGLRNYIMDDFRGLSDRNDAGALLENAAAVQLLKRELPINFWRSKQKSEVDFIIDIGRGDKIGLEVKKTFAPQDAASKQARDFRNMHPGIPLSFCSYNKPRDKGMDALFLGLI